MAHQCQHPDCGGVFASAADLEEHIPTHPGVVSPTCGKPSSTAGGLRRHRTLHQALSKLCYVAGCGKAFHRQDTLATHLQSEHGDLLEEALKRCGWHVSNQGN